MMQQPGEHHAIWHFWQAPDRVFHGWCINLQTAFVRTVDGYDTQDLELDLIFSSDRELIVKDAELLDQRVNDGRYTPELVDWIRRYGDELIQRLEHARRLAASRHRSAPPPSRRRGHDPLRQQRWRDLLVRLWHHRFTRLRRTSATLDERARPARR